MKTALFFGFLILLLVGGCATLPSKSRSAEPIEFELTMSKIGKLNEISVITAKITNNYQNKTIDGDLRLQMPDTISGRYSVSPRMGMSPTRGEIVWSGNLEPGQTIEEKYNIIIFGEGDYQQITGCLTMHELVTKTLEGTNHSYIRGSYENINYTDCKMIYVSSKKDSIKVFYEKIN